MSDNQKYYIAYDVKELQCVVEYVNANDPNLTRPLNIKEVAEKCVDIFFDKESEAPTFMGITFTYKSFPEDPTMMYCRLTVPVYYPVDDKTLKIVDVTEDLEQSVQDDINEEAAIMQETIKEIAEEMGVDVEDVVVHDNGLGIVEEEESNKLESSDSYVATDSKNKKLH